MSLAINPSYLAEATPFLEAQKQAPKLEVHDVAGRRKRFAAMVPSLRVPDGIEYRILQINVPGGQQIPIYHFKRALPIAPGATAAVLHAHGGGLISQSPEVDIERLGHMVLHSGVQIFSVDYRLAPENPYPAALDDVWAGLVWLQSNADQLGIDPRRIAVMGESAGGGLAAATALRARDRNLPIPIAKQILAYPMLDDRTKADGLGPLVLWSAEDNLTGWTAYLGRAPGGDDVPIFAAPGRMTDASGLPPLYLDTAQLDLYAKENTDYARKFMDAGIETEFHLYPGLPHGYDLLLPKFSVSQEVEKRRIEVLKSL